MQSRPSLLIAAWSIGAVLGPGVGGILTEPAINFPGTFSEDGVFGKCVGWVVGERYFLCLAPPVQNSCGMSYDVPVCTPQHTSYWYVRNLICC